MYDDTMDCTIEKHNIRVTITLKGSAGGWPNAYEVYQALKQAFKGVGFASENVDELMEHE